MATAPLAQPSSETRSGATQLCVCSQRLAAIASTARSRPERMLRLRVAHGGWVSTPGRAGRSSSLAPILRPRAEGFTRTAEPLCSASCVGTRLLAPGGCEWRLNVLNRFGGSTPMAGEAEVKYLDGDFRV